MDADTGATCTSTRTGAGTSISSVTDSYSVNGESSSPPGQGLQNVHASTRRSGRSRIAPVAFWKNEQSPTTWISEQSSPTASKAKVPPYISPVTLARCKHEATPSREHSASSRATKGVHTTNSENLEGKEISKSSSGLEHQPIIENNMTVVHAITITKEATGTAAFSPFPKKCTPASQIRRCKNKKIRRLRSSNHKDSTNVDEDDEDIAYIDIPPFKEMWSKLKTIGFYKEDGKFYLPEHSQITTATNSKIEGKDFFTSHETLRANLCRFGVPKNKHDCFKNEADQIALKSWVRLYIVSQFHKPNSRTIACNSFPTIQEAMATMEELGMKRCGRGFKLPADCSGVEQQETTGSMTWDDVRKHVARLGLTGTLAEHANRTADKNKIIDLLLYMKDIGYSKYFETFTRPRRCADSRIRPSSHRRPIKKEKSKGDSEIQKSVQLTKQIRARLSKGTEIPQHRKLYLQPTNPKTAANEQQNDCFYDTIGRVRRPEHASDFSWEPPDSASFYSKELGRVFYNGFRFGGQVYSVGNFIWVSDSAAQNSLYRVVGAFQAMKSFIGKWGPGDRKEIQKRGHAYLLLVPLIKKRDVECTSTINSKKKRKRDTNGTKSAQTVNNASHSVSTSTGPRTCTSNEVVLIAELRHSQDHVDALPYDLFDEGVTLALASVTVFRNMEEREKNMGPAPTTKHTLESQHFICSESTNKAGNLKALTSFQYCLLSTQGGDLTERHVSDEWHVRFNPRQVQVVNRKRIQRVDSYGLPYFPTNDSDDDSDQLDRGGDEEQEQQYVQAFEEFESLDDPIRVPKARRVEKDIIDSGPPPQLVIYSSTTELISSQLEINEEQQERVRIYREIEEQLGIMQSKMGSEINFEEKKKEVQIKRWGITSISDMFDVRRSHSRGRHTSVWADDTQRRVLNEIDLTRREIGYSDDFRELQQEVCLEALQGSSKQIIYKAPCGHGKTLCFVIPAAYERSKGHPGVTLVVEPLKTLIRNQVLNLRSFQRILKVENLLAIEESNQTSEDSAQKRLSEIASEITNKIKVGKSTGHGYILFTTPELLMKNDGVKNKLIELYDHGLMNRIVIDEFDVISESSINFRQAYRDLLPMLRSSFPGTKCMFLTATMTSKDLGLIDACDSKPSLFLTSRPLADNLIFSVEPKKNIDQVATRIASMIKDSPKKKPKCLCYCLTIKNCTEMAGRLINDHCIAAEVIHGKTDVKETMKIVEQFQRGKIQVLCCTSVLGRGFHASGITHIFHACMSISLSQYVQETGRAGSSATRPTQCTLFYRPQDVATVKRVMCLTSFDNNSHAKMLPEGPQREHAEDDIVKMTEYCTTGNKCRYSMLAASTTIKECEPSLKKCEKFRLCDNCKHQYKNSDVKITKFVYAFLNRFERTLFSTRPGMTEKATDDLMHEAFWKFTEEDPSHNDQLLIDYLRDGERGTSLRNDLLRFLTECNVLKFVVSPNERRIIAERSQFATFLDKVRAGDKSFFLRNVKLNDDRKRKPGSGISNIEDCSELPGWGLATKSKHTGSASDTVVDCLSSTQPVLDKGAICEAENFCSRLLTPWKGPAFFRKLNFLLQFELCRLYNMEKSRQLLDEIKNKNELMQHLHVNKALWKVDNQLHSACEFIHRVTKTNMRKYRSVLKAASTSYMPVDEQAGENSHGNGSSLFFRAIFKESPYRLTLLSPEPAADRRIFRKYGSHRFLHVDVPTHDSCQQEFNKLINRDTPLLLCGRQYRFLWCKATKSPQCYVMFAEAGIGISKEEELLVDIGSLKIVEDIMHGESEHTDGCGLVSREALDSIWNKYKEYTIKRERAMNPKSTYEDAIAVDDCLEEASRENSYCPYTSFQGRIGGMKGLWVLDNELTGFQLCTRHSQVKYNLPMRCLGTSLAVDPFYETVEICAWHDRLRKCSLNVRLVQILEHRVEVGKMVTFVDYLKQCVDEGTRFLRDESAVSQLLYTKRRATNENARDPIAQEQSRNQDMIFRMDIASINANEPVFAEKLGAFLTQEAESMRDKAKYPVKHCYYFPLIPDHTLLLDDGEAFIAVPDLKTRESLAQACECLAFRNPSYFSGDLRKLKLVSIEMLEHRASRKGTTFTFFNKLSYGLVLNSKGNRSEADTMSGGDYDGDEAWVCWEKVLVDLIRPCEPEDITSSDFEIRKDPKLELKLAKDAILKDRLEFATHFRKHHDQLGKLSNLLDRVNDHSGVNSPLAKKVGTQAFLQVDHPYFLCELNERDKDKLVKYELLMDSGTYCDQKMREPHWKVSSKNALSGRSYPSKKVLGVLWDYVKNKIEIRSADNQAGQKWNPAILEYVKQSHAGDIMKNELRRDMYAAAKNYDIGYSTLCRKMENDKCNEEERSKRTYEWSYQYCKEQRSSLIESQESLEKTILAAAILYEQTAKLASEKQTDGNVKKKAFAWYVARDLLVNISALEKAREAGCSLPLPLSREREIMYMSTGFKGAK